jgi:integrase
LANRSAVLYQRIKKKKKWTFSKVPESLVALESGAFYVSWYDGNHKCMDPVGSDPEAALAALGKKRLELAYVAAGGEIQAPEIALEANKKRLELAYTVAGGEIKDGANVGSEPAPDDGGRKSLSDAVKEYLADCKDRQGKSGYGLAVRTPKDYEYRLGFLIEFGPEAYLDEIDADFVKRFRHFLREHDKDLGDRTSYNILQAVSTFLIKNGSGVAKPILKEMSFPPTEVIPYSNDDMKQFFAACKEEEELIFKFFLHSMAREMEVAHCEVRDLKFDKNILHICPKRDRGFRLKGKRSGQETKGRKVPIPALFMARMKSFCAGKGPRELIFPNGLGKVEYHFLRKCENIAKRAGFSNWQDFDLHRWRKTGATKHHESGVSVRKIQAWLGHESLEVTLDYLGVEDAADEFSQEQVNNGPLAVYV